MEKSVKIKIKYLFSSLLIILIIIYSSINSKSNKTIPLVYLVPYDYFGPVFVFFGQKDGVDLLPDPLGQAVSIPENGVVKIKAAMDLILPRKKPNYQNIYWVSVSKNGTRKKMIINENTKKDSDWKSHEVYYDENGIPHKEPTGNGKFEYFSEKQKKENMIFGHGGCGENNFIPDIDATTKSPDCGRFLVISPNAYLDLPKWMWEDAHHPYSSMQQLEEEFDERLQQKKLYYKIK